MITGEQLIALGFTDDRNIKVYSKGRYDFEQFMKDSLEWGFYIDENETEISVTTIEEVEALIKEHNIMLNVYDTVGTEYPYIFIDELPEKEQPMFRLALFGHTCPRIGDGKRHAAYLHDYKAWKY
jgi:hypothetical protein